MCLMEDVYAVVPFPNGRVLLDNLEELIAGNFVGKGWGMKGLGY